MARIYPFRAFRYQTERAGAPLKNLVTQPYDKITPAMQERYYQLGPYNLIPLEKGKPEPGDNGENVYTRAARPPPPSPLISKRTRFRRRRSGGRARGLSPSGRTKTTPPGSSTGTSR